MFQSQPGGGIRVIHADCSSDELQLMSAQAKTPRDSVESAGLCEHRPYGTVLCKNLAIPTFALVGTIIGPESLTAVFGMGTGVSFPVWSPERGRSAVRRCELGWFGLIARATGNV
jgi:hypothetical protein